MSFRGLAVELRQILQKVAEGTLGIEEAERRIRSAEPSRMGWKQRLLMRSALGERRNGRFIALAFTGLGTIFTVVGVVEGLRSWDFASRGVETDGVIVNRIFAGGDPSEGSAPIVRFSIGEKSHEFQGRKSFAPDVGQSVRVVYLPENPSEGQIVSFKDRWMEPLMFGMLGSLFASLGIAMLVGISRE